MGEQKKCTKASHRGGSSKAKPTRLKNQRERERRIADRKARRKAAGKPQRGAARRSRRAGLTKQAAE